MPSRALRERDPLGRGPGESHRGSQCTRTTPEKRLTYQLKVQMMNVAMNRSYRRKRLKLLVKKLLGSFTLM
jgi:predicted GIY-YIG superfamily endonuclease